jgi:hypothetical protein
MSFSFFKRDYADIAREIRGKVGKKLSKKHQMDLIGIGGGMIKTVNLICLSFQIDHPLERGEARYLVVDCVEELLNAINNNEEVRPYLKNYPFTTKNVQIAIFSINPDRSDVYDPYITVASINESDKIYYRTSDSITNRYKHEYTEPYEEARAKVLGCINPN